MVGFDVTLLIGVPRDYFTWRNSRTSAPDAGSRRSSDRTVRSVPWSAPSLEALVATALDVTT